MNAPVPPDFVERELIASRPARIAPGPAKERLASRLRAEMRVERGAPATSGPALSFGALAAAAALFAFAVALPEPESASLRGALAARSAELRAAGLRSAPDADPFPREFERGDATGERNASPEADAESIRRGIERRRESLRLLESM